MPGLPHVWACNSPCPDSDGDEADAGAAALDVDLPGVPAHVAVDVPARPHIWAVESDDEGHHPAHPLVRHGRGRPPKAGKAARPNRVQDRDRVSAGGVGVDGRGGPRAPAAPLGWKDRLPVEDGENELTLSLRTALSQSGGDAPKRIYKECGDRAFDANKPRKLLPTTAEAQALGYENSTFVRNAFTCMGATCYVVSRLAYASIYNWAFDEQDSGNLTLKVEVQSLSTDETTMEVGQRIFKDLMGSLIAPAPEPSRKRRRRDWSQTENVAMKILQSELIVGLGWEWRDGRFGSIFTELPTKLQHADSYTGPNLYRSWAETLKLPFEDQRRDQIPIRAEMNGSDRGRNNGRGNRCARHVEPSKPRLDDLGCGVHNTHLGVKKQFNIFRPLTSGSIAFSLMQKGGGESISFRLCLQKSLKRQARPRLNTAPPPPEHPWMMYRAQVFDLLLSDQTAADVKQRLDLEYFFRGNLQSSEIDVFLFVPEDKLDEALTYWSEGAAWALYPKALEPFSKNRWATNMKSMEKHVLLDAVHTIKNPAINLYLAEVKNRDSAKPNVGNVAIVDGVPVFTNIPDNVEATASALWAALNHKSRVDSKQLAQEDYLMEEFILLLASKPAVRLCDRMIRYDSESFSRSEHVKSSQGEPRKFRILAAHNGEVTEKFYSECRELLWDPSAWDALPAHKQHQRSRGLSFAAVARLLGAIHFYMSLLWDGYPMKIWRLLDSARDPMEVHEEFEDDCPEMWDLFAKQFFSLFPDAKSWKSGECLLLLFMMAWIWRLTMARIECRHASLRRLLLCKGLTWKGDIANLASDWILQRQRIIQELTAKMQQCVKRDGDGNVRVDLSEEATEQATSRAGGGHREFLSDWLRTDEANDIDDLSVRMSTGHAKWNGLKATGGPQYDHYVQLGRARKLQSQLGPGRRPSERPAGNGDALNHLNSLASEVPDDPHETALVAFEGMTYQELVKRKELALAVVQEHNREARQRELDTEKELLKWVIAKTATPKEELPVPGWEPGGGIVPHVEGSHGGGSFVVEPFVWCPTIDREVCESLSNGIDKQVVTDAWQRQCDIIKVAECPSYGEPAKPEPKGLCYYAGFCVCFKPRLNAFVGYLQGTLRSWFVKGSQALSLLEMGMVVLHFFSDIGEDMFFHMSHEDRTTWRCSFMELFRDLDGWRQSRASALGQIALVSADREYCGLRNLWRCFRDVNFVPTWSVQCCCISAEGDCPVERRLPRAYVLVEDVFEMKAAYVWPGWYGRPTDKRSSGGRKPSAKAGIAAAPAPAGAGPVPIVGAAHCPGGGAAADGDAAADHAHDEALVLHIPEQLGSEHGDDANADDELADAVDLIEAGEAFGIVGAEDAEPEDHAPTPTPHPPGGEPAAADGPSDPAAGPSDCPVGDHPAPGGAAVPAEDHPTPVGEPVVFGAHGPSPAPVVGDGDHCHDGEIVAATPPVPKAPRALPIDRHDWDVLVHVYSRDGSQYLGCIKHSRPAEMMVAWCLWCDPTQDPTERTGAYGTHGKCCLFRHTRDDGLHHKGRPLSLLVTWLQLAHVVGTQQDHLALTNMIGKSDRLDTRAWTEARSFFDAARERERHLRDGEPVEPDKNP